MVSQRGALKAKRTEANLHDADMERLTEMWQQQVVLLSEHIDEIEGRIADLLADDPALNQRHRQMRTAPGMGKVLTPLWVNLRAGFLHGLVLPLTRTNQAARSGKKHEDPGLAIQRCEKLCIEPHSVSKHTTGITGSTMSRK